MNQMTGTLNQPSLEREWFKETKSHLTNFISILCIVVGYQLPEPYGKTITTMGYFAFSGAITNWLAVHMLFEKVPFLYGSGVITNRFQEFKQGIQELILTQFFTPEHIGRFLKSNSLEAAIKQKLKQLDHDKIYESLLDAIMNSSFGNMLAVLGGASALAPLKEPIMNKLTLVLQDIASETLAENKESQLSTLQLSQQIRYIVEERLTELTPLMVKRIIQTMIQKHLGWLVVWGGVFGGLIGGAVSLL